MITLPPDVETPLLEEARKQGTSPETLAINALRKLFVSEGLVEGSLYDFLSDYIGTVSGSSDAFSEKTGKHFTDLLVEKQQRAQS